jgi:predicted CoA-binding protein
MQTQKTLVIGASDKPERYSYKAIQMLRKHAIPVVAIGNKAGKVADIAYSKDRPLDTDIHTITLYLNETHQQEYYSYILALQPKRIIFNPGTENDELMSLASKQGIICQEACTLVLLSTGQY